ncbi:hypothetical protein BJ742DRAFT_828067 [Cladochytrium replicatum]|nr:hypothetical protein BJ742DRAFT_828067 [Cladochytrium replicatum]
MDGSEDKQFAGNRADVLEDEQKSEPGDEEEEESLEDDEEPKLKYARLKGTLGEMLKKDNVSSFAVSDRFLALGTHGGVVHILDINGNDTRRFECHSATVHELCIDTTGEYVASASDDGKVVINNLYANETQVLNYKRPVRAVALEQDYSKKQSRQVVSGGMAESLVLSTKGWLGAREVVLDSGEGPIYTVKWRQTYIAWANEAGVKIYDVVAQQKFAFIDRPPNSPRGDLFRCNLCWKTDAILLIGWADSVKVGVIKERSKIDVASGLPAKYVEITAQFRTDYIVSGIAPLAEDLVILAYLTDIEDHKLADALTDAPIARKKAKPPEIHLVNNLGEEIANDMLSLNGFELYQANDYHLESLDTDSPNDAAFYVVSPKDIVVARPRDLDDHIEWLVERRQYEQALLAAEEAGNAYAGRLQVANILEIGQKYLTTLIEEGRFNDAAALCPKILRTDATLWEHWIFVFAKHKEVKTIKPFIPTNNPQLSSTVYNMVLAYFLNSDHETFLETVKEWPPELLIGKDLTDEAEKALSKEPNNAILLEAAYELNVANKQFNRALIHGLKSRKPNILNLVKLHNLYSVIQNHVSLVMEYDEHMIDCGYYNIKLEKLGDEELDDTLIKIRKLGFGTGLQIFVSNTDMLPMVATVKQLVDNPRWLHVFLDAVFQKDPHEAAQFHPLQVALYAEYDYPALSNFLRVSTYYKLDDAYDICEIRDLVPEMVYLLGKMGNNRKALYMIIERLGDVQRAIDFAKEQNDEDLWEDLIKYSMDKPKFIIGLLENLGSHIDPIRLIKRLPNNLEIPGLRGALIKIMTDYGIQMSLREGCEKILISDTVELLENLYRAQKRGLSFTEGTLCAICDNHLTYEGINQTSRLIFFFCRHVFHESCLHASMDAKTKGTVKVHSMTQGNQADTLAAAEQSIKLVYADGKSGMSTISSDTGKLSIPVNLSWRSGDTLSREAKKKAAHMCPICRNVA